MDLIRRTRGLQGCGYVWVLHDLGSSDKASKASSITCGAEGRVDRDKLKKLLRSSPGLGTVGCQGVKGYSPP